MVIGDEVAAAPPGNDGDPDEFRQPEQVIRGPGAQHATAGEDDRTLRAGEEMADGPDLLVARAARHNPGRLRREARRYLEIEKLLGEGHQDRTGTPCRGLFHGATDSSNRLGDISG